ncbi:MAG: S1/P1 nuclease, partial [Rhodanobacter sp.]
MITPCRPHRFLSLLGASCLFVATFATQAWGPEGHAMVADIAQQHLNPMATAHVGSLLKLEGLSRLDEISSWA